MKTLQIAIFLTVLQLTPLANANDCVILLHGLARTANSMQDLADALVGHGYDVANIDYPSRKHPIEELAPMAIDQGIKECQGATKIHFVTHSLGGILTRYYLKHNHLDNLGRVVMLGPPNQGSEVVDKYRNVPGFVEFNGPAILQLGTDQDSVPLKLGAVDYEVGIIAGTKTINPILSQSLPSIDDGKVTVENTKVAGMQDFIDVPHSHPYIMKSDLVIQNMINFFASGRFLHNED